MEGSTFFYLLLQVAAIIYELLVYVVLIRFQIQSAKNDIDLRGVLQQESSMTCLAEAGYFRALSMVSVDDIIAAVTTFYIFIKVKAAMDQFQQGLEAAGVLSYMRKYTDLIRPMFVDESVPFTAGKLCDTMVIPILHICVICKSSHGIMSAFQ